MTIVPAPVPLTPNERELFGQLIATAQVLCTVADNAATVLSEEFESMVTGPLSACQAVLDLCPAEASVNWDGTFRIQECDEELFTPDVPESIRPGRINVGVKLTHRPTGLSVESKSSADVNKNRLRARQALAKRTETLYARKSGDRRPDPLQ